MNKEFEREKRLLILLSRVTMSENDKRCIEELTHYALISWCEFFKYALKNKVCGLVWYNLKKLGYAVYIPKYIKTIFNFISIGHREQNSMYMKYRDEIKSVMKERGIDIIPVKGAMLLDTLYPDYSTRALGDLDFLVEKKNLLLVDLIMNDLGYKKGTYSSRKGMIIPATRMEEIIWKIAETNMYPYVKQCNHDYLNYAKIDFRHSLEKSLNPLPVSEIMKYWRDYGMVCPAHIYVYLSIHLYHESSNAASVLFGKDINLIKFCDMREYAVQQMNTQDFETAIIFSKKYNLIKEVYYATKLLKMIYNDGYEDTILSELQCESNILDEYYDESSNTSKIWKKDFFARLFAADNFDETGESIVSYISEKY